MEDLLVVIPARIGSKRLPKKPLAKIMGEPLISLTVKAVKSFTPKVLVATDSREVAKVAKEAGAEVRLTPSELPSGTDRVYQAVKDLPYRFIINVQGDEPFVEEEHLEKIYLSLKGGDRFATLATPFKEIREVENPARVKVVIDKEGYALYFSRSPIPHFRDEMPKPEKYLKHLGVYGYTKEALKDFVSWPVGELEEIEKLEQLRILENGGKIKVCIVEKELFGIDTEEDLKRAEKILREVKGWPQS
ncbi:3-deoxy-manno-octulosonate cytidylyltransferase [Thermovibrio sp.]